MMSTTIRFAAPFLVLLLAACAGGPSSSARPQPLTDATPGQMLAAIEAAAGSGDGELAVMPLRDPMVEDLRERARAARGQSRYDEAAGALARALAERAFALGAQVGPLCRRHWATIEQVRLATGDAEGAASAAHQVQGCRVAGPERY